MFNTINKACITMCLCLFSLMESLDGLSPKDFYNENKEFSLWPVTNEVVAPEKAISLPWHYSPFWGVVLLKSGFMERMRFCGNKTLDYFEDNVYDARRNIRFQKGDRKYANSESGGDEGNSAIEKLQIKLFPSVAGTLSHFVNDRHYFGHMIEKLKTVDKREASESVAGLLVLTEFIRFLNENKTTDGKNRPAVPKERLNEIISEEMDRATKPIDMRHLSNIKNSMHRKKTARNRPNMKKSLLCELLDNKLIRAADIYEAIQDEKYLHKYAVEHFLLTFATKVFPSKNEMKAFIDIYSDIRNRIFAKTYIDAENARNSSEEKTSIAIFAEKMCNDILRSHETGEDMPYTSPVENGKAVAYKSDGTPSQKDFADCMETSIRHTFNFVLGKSGLENFDKASLKKNVIDFCKKHSTEPISNKIDVLKAFYEANKNTPNSGTEPTRDLWNKVMSLLGEGVEYIHNEHDENVDIPCKNELKCGFNNFINTISAVLGIDPQLLDAEAISAISENEKITKKLETLFKIIRPELDYDFENVEISNGDKGKLTVRVKSKENVGKYKFTIVQKLTHAYVELPQSRVKLNCETSDIPDEKTIKSLAGYLYDSCSDNIYSKVFCYHNELDTTWMILRATETICELYKKHKDDEVKILEAFMENISRSVTMTANDVNLLFDLVPAGSHFNKTIVGKIYNALRKGPLNKSCNMLDNFRDITISSLVDRYLRFPVEIDDETASEIIALTLRSRAGISYRDLSKFTNLKCLTIESDTFVNFDTVNVEKLEKFAISGSGNDLDFSKIPHNFAKLSPFEKLYGTYNNLIAPPSLGRVLKMKDVEINGSLNLLGTGIKSLELQGMFNEIILPEEIETLTLRGIYKKDLVLPKTLTSFNVPYGIAMEATLNLSNTEISTFAILPSVSYCSCIYSNIILPKSLETFRCGNGITVKGKLDLSRATMPSLELKGTFNEIDWPQEMRSLILKRTYLKDLKLPPTLTSFNAKDATINGKIYTNISHEKLTLPSDYNLENVLHLEKYAETKGIAE